jgi:hypothetical protein
MVISGPEKSLSSVLVADLCAFKVERHRQFAKDEHEGHGQALRNDTLWLRGNKIPKQMTPSCTQVAVQMCNCLIKICRCCLPGTFEK